MAKGRRLTSSRSERLLGSYGYGETQEMVNESPELLEDDVWSMVDGMVNGGDQFVHDHRSAWSPSASTESDGTFSGGNYRGNLRRPPPSISDHEHLRRQLGGLSLAFEDPGGTNTTSSSPRIVHQFRAQEGGMPSPRGKHMATSAPVNVPDWSKIYRVDSMESLLESDDGGGNDPESEWVPPHEYLAREYSRSRKMAANSVLEGVGRTLKGRDLSRVRDAVWSQTGFDG